MHVIPVLSSRRTLNALLVSVVGTAVLATAYLTISRRAYDGENSAISGNVSQHTLVTNSEDPITYLLYLPKSYAADKPCPLVLYLHGSWQRGTDISQVRACGLPRLIDSGEEYPFMLVAPQCGEFASWEPSKLLELLDSIEQGYAVDDSRIYVTGMELGGYGTWNLAATDPDRFAAIVPFGGHPSEIAKRETADWLKSLAVWSFYNENDQTTEVDQCKLPLSSLWKQGGYGRQTALTDSNESFCDAWTRAYPNSGVIAWMLKQRKRSTLRTDWKEEPKPRETARGTLQSLSAEDWIDLVGFEVYLPTAYTGDTNTSVWPLVLCLYEGNDSTVDREDTSGLWEKLKTSEQFICVSARASANDPISVESLWTLIGYMHSEFRVTPERIFLVGERSGSQLAWETADSNAIDVTALALIDHVGTGNFKAQANRLAKVPKWFLAGDDQIGDFVEYCRLASQYLAPKSFPAPELVIANTTAEKVAAYDELVGWLSNHPRKGMRGRFDRWARNDRPIGILASPEAASLFAKVDFEFSGGRYHKANIPYRLFSPAQIRSGGKYPLIIWLHGHGPPELHLDEAELQYIDFVLTDPQHPEKFPFFIMVMQCPGVRAWFGRTASANRSQDEGDEPISVVMSIVGDLCKRHPIDRNKISIVGISSGGNAGFELAKRHGGFFSGVAILGSAGCDIERLENLRSTPIWAFHSAMDRSVSPEGIRNTFSAAKQIGLDMRLTEIPRSSHHCWAEAFQDHGLLDWLLTQSR